MQIGFHRREACPLCESKKLKCLSELSYQNEQLVTFIEKFYQGRVPLATFPPENYRVVICSQCDFIFQDTILDCNGMQALYHDWIDQASSLQKKKTAKSKLFRQYAGQVHTLSRLFDRQPDQVRVLDFGMGWGYWSRMAQAHGFDVVGYEMSTRRIEHARQMGIRVIDSLTPQEADFDCVYANQVFEHLSNPVESLQELCLHLAPEGVVYIRVPDGRGMVERLASRGWSPELDAIHPLEHINCFTRKTLLALGAKAGLKPFNPPLRLNLHGFRGGIMREFADRMVTTHLYFRR